MGVDVNASVGMIVGSAATAASSCTRGTANPSLLIDTPVVRRRRSNELTSAVGKRWRRTIHAPVAIAAALDVPLFAANVLPGTDELTVTPGAYRLKSADRFEKLATISVCRDHSRRSLSGN